MRTAILTFLALALGSAAAAGDAPSRAQLVARLDADYRALRASSPDREALREAERFLERTDRSGRWGEYRKALSIIRKTRARAAIPLLLKYAILHAGFSTAHVLMREYDRTLVILTGADIELLSPTGRDRARSGHDNVARLVRTWWTPGKETITTDLSKMKADGVRRVTGRLLGAIEVHAGSARDRDKPERIASRLYRLLRHESSDRPAWLREELHPVMLPHLLAMAGHRTDFTTEATASVARAIPYRAIAMLAALREDGHADLLDKAAADARQPEVARLTCILAIAAAGEPLQTPALLKILDQTQRVSIKVPVILALQYSRRYEDVTPRLLALLDDRNQAVVTAATYALSGPAPASAVPKLKTILDTVYPRDAIYPAIRLLEKIKTRASAQALADFMAAALEEERKSRYLSHALSAFGRASGCPIRSPAGIPKPGVREARVQQALDWWVLHRKRMR